MSPSPSEAHPSQPASSTTPDPSAHVPRGELFEFSFDSPTLYPGTRRSVWVYVPVQYQPAKPACLFVCQDGVLYDAPRVMDQLIAAGEMPVTIGVFISPGRVLAEGTGETLRVNRSFEYDSVDDRYVRFLLEELLPAVEMRTTADGRAIRLSTAAADRAIGGASSGAIAAFNAAWHRPDAFSRVFSAVGSYVNLRGGNGYPNLVRKSEPRALRVFLQSGENDARFLAGDWWIANLEMERALQITGYDVAHAFGSGDHSAAEVSALFPDALRWLWRGWPEPVQAGAGSEYFQALTPAGEGWHRVAQGLGQVAALAADADGVVYVLDRINDTILRLGPDGAPQAFVTDAREAAQIACGPDGRLYAASPTRGEIVAWDAHGVAEVVASGAGFQPTALAVRGDGSLYVATGSADSARGTGQLWLLRGGERMLLESGLEDPQALTLAPGGQLLFAASAASRFITSFVCQPDGSLAARQAFHVLETAWGAGPEETGAQALQATSDGPWLFSATRLGVQVSDGEGRTLVILTSPGPDPLTALCFGGSRSSQLYVGCGGSVYARPLKVRPQPGK